MRRILLVFTILATAIQAAQACTCIPPADGARNMREVAEAYANSKYSSAIFVGRVLKQEVRKGSVPPGNSMSMTSVGAFREVTLSVSEAFRGIAAGQVKLTTNISEAGCGFDFRTGQEYLVYANQLPDGNLTTSLCSGTELAGHSGPALRQLRRESPTADDLLDPQAYFKKMYAQWDGIVCGHVFKDGRPAGGISVDLSEIRDDGFDPNQFSDQNLSKPDGSYCIDAAPGKYRLSAGEEDYDHNRRYVGYWPSGVNQKSAQVVEVKSGQRASWYDVQLQPQDLYELLIRVVTSEGAPAPERIGVAITDASRDARSYWLERNEPENGVYYFGYVPPGDYSIKTYPSPNSESQLPDVMKLKMAELKLTVSHNMRLTIKLDAADGK